MSDDLRFRDEQHVRDAVERLTEYMRTYDQQYGYESYSAQTFIDDVLYGLGVAIEPEAHQFAQGFQVFKEGLANHLGLVRADLAAERELEHVGWQQRYLCPDEGPSIWVPCTDKHAAVLARRDDYEVRKVYAIATHDTTKEES